MNPMGESSLKRAAERNTSGTNRMTRSRTKKLNEDRLVVHNILPEAQLYQIYKYLTGNDLGACECVCSTWYELISTAAVADSILWANVVKREHPIAESVREIVCQHQHQNQQPHQNQQTWKQAYRQRKAIVSTFGRSYKEEEIDYYYVHHEETAPTGNKVFPFTVSVWSKEGRMYQQTGTTNRSARLLEVALPLGNDSVHSVCALKIHLVNEDGETALLYSGAIDPGAEADSICLPQYCNYDKFAAMRLMASQNGRNSEGGNFCLSYPTAVARVAQDATLTLEMVWTVTDGEPVRLEPMELNEVVLFCEKGVSFGKAQLTGMAPSRTADPSVVVSSNFAPRPLSSYAFVVDMFSDELDEENDATRPILSRCYDSLHFDTANSALDFQLSEDWIEHFSPPLPCQHHPLPEHLSLVVHVIEKTTGKHAKLFEGGVCGFDSDRHGDERWYFMLGDFQLFRQFAAGSYLSQRDRNGILASPCIDGRVFNDASPILKLEFMWWYHEIGSSTGSAPQLRAMLTFLDKCIDYE